MLCYCPGVESNPLASILGSQDLVLMLLGSLLLAVF